MRKFEEYYVAFWCLTMPVTSFVIIPAIPGTIIAYLLGFGSLGFVALRMGNGEVPAPLLGYIKTFAMVLGLWIILLCGSQIGNLLNPQLDFQSLYTISDETSNMFRSSLFTQSVYLFACVFIALYFRYFLPEAWMKYVYWGAWLLVIYGLYDWTFYLVFHESGDFIENRTFGDSNHPGSWSQGLDVGGLAFLRLKSCLGEPSFLSAVVIPYMFMAIEGKRKYLAILLFVSAILSTSTTVYFGLIAAIFIQALWSEKSRMTSLAILGVLVLTVVVMALFLPDTYRFLFEDKLSGDTVSGQDRLKNIEDYEILFSNFSLINWIFGIGFGYVYFSLLWSITANTGLLGIATFLYAFLKPGYLLPRANRSEWLKISMIAIVIVVAITLTELFIPTTWMFLGLAYRRLDQLKLARELPISPLALRPEPSLEGSVG
jgi:hypothetical protein